MSSSSRCAALLQNPFALSEIVWPVEFLIDRKADLQPSVSGLRGRDGPYYSSCSTLIESAMVESLSSVPCLPTLCTDGTERRSFSPKTSLVARFRLYSTWNNHDPRARPPKFEHRTMGIFPVGTPLTHACRGLLERFPASRDTLIHLTRCARACSSRSSNIPVGTRPTTSASPKDEHIP